MTVPKATKGSQTNSPPIAGDGNGRTTKETKAKTAALASDSLARNHNTGDHILEKDE